MKIVKPSFGTAIFFARKGMVIFLSIITKYR